ncbi:glyoxalase/bleomycin resistance/dioxygenase family protein [Nocardia puris]|uniref:VOC domain-containing protein n=1 Tax=Nocardia puris TaxID=208602 RepID=A0A366DUH7_9NOCA|nr:glyoxalase/bleomycin resistance/dioxygenase family protein [Nocardia puris]MBF6210323.1 glyoxalase/bleomycin resistance/dioxygenase family protein [Nocardia puris]MBF6367398.1 glyoxalase/bleomycin resistance/dioxygenase family protein [Nocardia puris]MBF6457583.1 glyoxalase/bleomycin resistance/dioxygenase family protein [Nocardia puris]RBO93746.1 hypothetical protein DFR74_102163 [Nocardia puris]
MSIERVGTILPAENLLATVGLLEAVLGAPPTFVDDDRWAQFDVGPARIMVAGTDRENDGAALSVKVSGLDEILDRLRAAGIRVGDPVTGPHERRVVVDSGAVWSIILYEPLGG